MSTIENTHNKILEKLRGAEGVLQRLNELCAELDIGVGGVYIGLTIAEIIDLENEYLLRVAGVITDYYTNQHDHYTDDYYRILNGENFILRVGNIIDKCIAQNEAINAALMREHKKYTSGVSARMGGIAKQLEFLASIEIPANFDKIDYKRCVSCGAMMEINAELSELQCACGLTSKIIGMVFRDDQFYPQEGQKSKHGGYDPSRHFKFWIDRIQGIENKEFPPEDSARIDAMITRERMDRMSLTIHNMRNILKELQLTKYNDHAVLLVITHGGVPPPRLTIDENKKMSILFRKVMSIYEEVIESGNKPYYPYFIYKIIETEFRGNREKLQLLNYIHLQSRDTVIKNDKIYEKICARSDGLIYSPTKPRV